VKSAATRRKRESKRLMRVAYGKTPEKTKKTVAFTG
jgi:hypothetical protein